MIYCKKNIIFILLTIVSVLLTSFGVLPGDFDSTKSIVEYVNPYLNIFNWLGIFVLGMYLREYDVIKKLVNLSNATKFMIFAGIIAIYAFSPTFDKITLSSYWSHFALILEFLLFIAIIILACWIDNGLFADIGAKTMPVYMAHMLIIGKFNAFFRSEIWFALLRPVLCIGLIYTLVWFGLFIARLIKLDKIYKLFLGIR